MAMKTFFKGKQYPILQYKICREIPIRSQTKLSYKYVFQWFQYVTTSGGTQLCRSVLCLTFVEVSLNNYVIKQAVFRFIFSFLLAFLTKINLKIKGILQVQCCLKYPISGSSAGKSANFPKVLPPNNFNLNIKRISAN